MASKRKIEIDFANANAQAKKLDELSGQLLTVADRKIEDILKGVSGNWNSQSADIYLKKGSILQSEMKGTAGQMHGIANDIREIARKIYEAEMRALERAKRRHSQ